MAKIRRNQGRIASGIISGLQNALKFGSRRRGEVIESLHEEEREKEEQAMDNYFDNLLSGEYSPESVSEPVPFVGGSQPVPPVETVPPVAPKQSEESVPPIFASDDFELESGIKGLAINAHKLGRENEIRTMFLLFIDNYTKYIQENPQAADLSIYQEKLETKRNQLDEFDKEIVILLIEEKIEQTVHGINLLAEEIAESFDVLVSELGRGDLSNLESRLSELNLKISGSIYTPTDYQVALLTSSKEELISLLKRSEELTGKFRTFMEFDLKIPFDDQMIEKYYRAIKTTMNTLEAEQKPTDILNKYIDLLPLLTENSLKFDEIKKMVDEQLLGESKQNPVDSDTLENIKLGYEALLDVKYKAINDKIVSLATEFKHTDDELEALLNELEVIKNNEKTLSQEIKNEIEMKIASKYNDKNIEMFGDDLCDFIYDYVEELSSRIEEVKKCEYGSTEFDTAYGQLMETISNMTKAGEKAGVKVSFDESTQKLNMDFLASVMKSYEAQVVTDNVLKVMREKAKGEENKENTEKENQRVLFKKLVEELYVKYDALLEQQLRTLTFYSKSDVDRELVILFCDERVNLLTNDEKNDIIDIVKKECFNRQEINYGSGFVDFVNNNIISILDQSGIRNLESLSVTSPEFKSEYLEAVIKVKAMVDYLQSNEEAKKYIKNISYDEETQKLVVEYVDGYYISKSESQLISENFMKQIETAKGKGVGEESAKPVPPVQPAPQPVPLATSSSIGENDEQKDIEDYISKLEEANRIVDLLNEINLKLTSQAIMSFVQADEAKDTIQMEDEAKELDQRLMALKVEMSKDRLKFKQKYNKYMLSLPEVKTLHIKETLFSGELKTFIAQHDEMIAEAESQIFEIDVKRKNGEILVEEASANIQTLLDFIEAQNSLVGRRLVSEAQNTDIDIVALLQERRENKKEIREKLRQIRENEEQEPAKKDSVPSSGADTSEEMYKQDLEELQNVLEKELMKQVLRNRKYYDERPFVETLTPETKNLITSFETKYSQSVADLIDRVSFDYNSIIGREKDASVTCVLDSINYLKFSITEEDVLNDEFDSLLNKNLNYLVNRYRELNDLKITFESGLNCISVKFTKEEYNFETNSFEIKPSSIIINEFLSKELYDKYRNKKKQAVVINNDILRNVAMYFIENYSNGMVVFRAVACSKLMKNFGYTLEEVEEAIQILNDKGIIENRNGVISANVNVDELDTVLSQVDDVDVEKKKGSMEVEHEQGQSEPEINIVQRGLSFNPKNLQQFTDTSKNIITVGDVVTISLIKNGIKIKYSQELREKLSQLNAKLSLVNKANYRIRTSQAISNEEQTIGFKDEREIKPEDYKIEIRVPSEGETNPLYEFDLQDVSEELKTHSK